MANPFLALGGIAVGVVTAAFVLSVSGWVSSAQDSAAINDLAQVAAVQAAAASTEGAYLPALSDLAVGPGIEMTGTPGVRLGMAVSADRDQWCAVAQSQSGSYFSSSSTDSTAVMSSGLAAAQSASCDPSWTWATDGDGLGAGTVPDGPTGWAEGITAPMNAIQPQGAAVITAVAWQGPVSTDPNQTVCAVTTITGNSTTPGPWSVTFDRAAGPFAGSTGFHNNGHSESTVTYTEGDGILTVTGKADSTPFNPAWQNRQISSADEMTFYTCATQQQAPAAAPASWVNITQARTGTWTATQACVTLTATGMKTTDEVGIRYGWEGTLDLGEAFAHMRANGGTPTWIGLTPGPESGVQYTLDPGSPSAAVETYRITSGWKTSLLGTEAKAVKACVNGY